MSPASNPHASANLSGLASGLRPHYFNSASSISSSTSSLTPPSPSSGSSKVPFSTLLVGKGVGAARAWDPPKNKNRQTAKNWGGRRMRPGEGPKASSRRGPE
ncbi:hypothetical protein DFH11DRAFT_1726941 [Phellopilus nigrolimitatus]|nr:hypothetical protein DFH11DRAFT_1726941 [Phellopilus nigrolimitatus]